MNDTPENENTNTQMPEENGHQPQQTHYEFGTELEGEIIENTGMGDFGDWTFYFSKIKLDDGNEIEITLPNGPENVGSRIKGTVGPSVFAGKLLLNDVQKVPETTADVDSDQDMDETQSKKPNLKGWAMAAFAVIVGGIIVIDEINKMEPPSVLPDTHAGYGRAEPGAPKKHFYDPNSRSNKGHLPETHYVKGDLTEVFVKPDGASDVTIKLSQNTCVAVTKKVNDEWAKVYVREHPGEETYIRRTQMRKLRPNQGCK